MRRPARGGLPLGVTMMADVGGPRSSPSHLGPPAAAAAPSATSDGDDGDDPASASLLHALPDAIKLGLGDFIFYSVLVGRASMGDGLEAGAAFLGVLAGLGATLAALALHQSALPALPISIALGAACTAAARWVVEPVVVPLATSMLYF